MAREKLKIDVTHDQIERSHRLGKPRPSTPDDPNPRPRKIIVKFAAYSTRYKVFGARRDLKGQSLYINEHLTNYRSHLFHLARMTRKEKKLLNVWTANGHIRVKDTTNEIHTIRIPSDLKKFDNYPRATDKEDLWKLPPPGPRSPPRYTDWEGQELSEYY